MAVRKPHRATRGADRGGLAAKPQRNRLRPALDGDLVPVDLVSDQLDAAKTLEQPQRAQAGCPHAQRGIDAHCDHCPRPLDGGLMRV